MPDDDSFSAAPPGGDDDGGRRGRRKGKARLRVPEDVVRRERARPAPSPSAADAPPDAVRDDEEDDGDEERETEPQAPVTEEGGVVVMGTVVVIGNDDEAPGVSSAAEASAPIEVDVDAGEPDAERAEEADEEAAALGDDDVEELEPEPRAEEAPEPAPAEVQAAAPAPKDESEAQDGSASAGAGVAAAEAPADSAEEDARPTVPAPPPDEAADRSSLPPEEIDDDSIEMDATPAEEPAAKPSRPPPTPAATASKPAAAPPVTADVEALAFLKASRARRARPWWEDLFTEEWMRVFPPPPESQMDREVEFIEQSLGVAPGGWILDVACGTGHHAIGLAKRGYQVVGVDLSLAMLARCAEEAQEAGQKITFLHSDMRELTFVDTYDGAYNIGTSFGYFDDEQNVSTIQGIHRALKPKGLLFLETTNRDYVLRSLPSLVWFEGDGCVCMEESSLNPISSRLHVRRTMILNDGTQKTAEYSIRLYALHEIGGILHSAGFRVAEVSGSWATPGAFFGAESQRIMILAEKRAPGSRVSGTMPTVQLPIVREVPAPTPAAGTPVVTSPAAPSPPPAPPQEEEDAPERTWIPPVSRLTEETTPPPRRAQPTRPDLPAILGDDGNEKPEPKPEDEKGE